MQRILGSGAAVLARGVSATPANLVSIQARAFSSNGEKISKVGVVGLGLMGHGIAQISAQSGLKVVAFENDQKALDVGTNRIKKSLEKIASKQVEKGKLDQAAAQALVSNTLANIQPTLNKEDLADCDLVVEAIIENLDIKKKLHAELAQITKPSTILATNTSSLSVGKIAEATGRPDRTIGLHYFNPVQLMGLVEVVRIPTTSDAVFQEALNFVKKTGKTPVSCKDTPGFVVNRLLIPYLSQALLLLERGDASKEDIDAAMRLGAGHPMGPLTLADYVGLDTTLFVLEGWKKDYPNEPAFVIPEILREKVKQGKLGRKTGEGFYKWEGDKVVA